MRLVSKRLQSCGTSYEGQGKGKKVHTKLKWGKKEESWESRCEVAKVLEFQL